ncbi:MAG: threonine--tRNA ligase [Acholeplasmataceae bacterium]|nr:threonine--tRNA ligase [Acholeplasmataceae bacterium]
MKITFPDQSVKVFEKGVTPYEIAKSISDGLANMAIGAIFNDEYISIDLPLKEDGEISILTKRDERSLKVLNHSAAHLMAEAIRSLYPHALFGVGPAIEEGFYYDVDFGDDVLREDDLIKIEDEMRRLSKAGAEITREVLTYDEARKFFHNDPYKLELIEQYKDEEISVHTQNDFTDLCRGGHVKNTKEIKHFKLLSLAGAYWRGDSKNKMLTRIYGISFWNKKDLDEYLEILEERKKRDHRKLGRELGIFMLSEYGPGFPFWLPNGVILKRELINYWYEVHDRHNYKYIETPTMLNQELWEISGHWFNYRDNMYTSQIDDKLFAIKPMNCPGGMLVYKNDIHSYRDLPLRVGELGHVHRYEASGALNGLFRVRAFTQDDAHVYMREDQVIEEAIELIKLFDEIYDTFGLSYHIELSTRPEENFIGTIEAWEKSEKALYDAAMLTGKEVKINPGDGAFYGPKLDYKIRDSLNRIWQCGTIQLDMNLPERFELHYIDDKGERVRPIMMHRAIYGSLERFIGILIEYYGGAFPAWLAPLQVKVIPVNLNHHLDYAKEVVKNLKKAGIRAEIDAREEKLGYKIREAQTSKIPYSLVIGDKEVESNLVTYRKYGETEQVTLEYQKFEKLLKKVIKDKQ